MKKPPINIINNAYMTLWYLSYNPIIINLMFIIYMSYTSEALICDDNTTAVGGWGGELDGRPITHSTGQGDITDYNQQTQNKPNQPELQQTSEGYRSEVSDTQINNSVYDAPPSYDTHTRESLYRDSDGNEYGWKEGINYPNREPSESFYKDSNGNEYGWKEGVNYTNHANESFVSTNIGEIEPTRSEVLGKGYYQTGWPKCIDTSKSSISRRIFTKAKISIKNHIAKSNELALAENRRKSEKLAKDLQRFRDINNAHRRTRTINMNKGTPKFTKVRRFD